MLGAPEDAEIERDLAHRWWDWAMLVAVTRIGAREREARRAIGQPPQTRPHGGVVGWCGDPEEEAAMVDSTGCGGGGVVSIGSGGSR